MFPRRISPVATAESSSDVAKPPVTMTVAPPSNGLAACQRRACRSDGPGPTPLLDGSKTSVDASGSPPGSETPPAITTRPSARSVAVCSARGTVMRTDSSSNVRAAGFHNSIVSVAVSGSE